MHVLGGGAWNGEIEGYHASDCSEIRGIQAFWSLLTTNQNYREGEALILSVHQNAVDSFLCLNNFDFWGTKLSITEIQDFAQDPPSAPFAPNSGAGLSAEADNVQTQMRRVLANRYHVDLKMLDLSQLIGDPNLTNLQVLGKSASTHAKVFAALMKMCDMEWDTPAKKHEHVESVKLDANDLSDVSVVTTLAPTFPGLRRLSLASNGIASLGGMRIWRWKFRHLEVLDLSNNPVGPKTETDFAATLMKWYPKLQFLNGERIRTPEEIANIEKSPIPILAPTFQDEAQIAENFIKEFFPGFDVDRHLTLDKFYDHRSTFSISANNGFLRGERTAEMDPHSLDFRPYLPLSRNLLRVSHLSTRVSRSFANVDKIREQWDLLPKTRHPQLLENPADWLIECHPLPGLPEFDLNTGKGEDEWEAAAGTGGVGGLIVMVHAKFEEIDPTTTRSLGAKAFDRTFVLGPGNGLGGIRVISDILCIRALPKGTGKEVEPCPQELTQNWIPAVPQEVLREAAITTVMQNTGLNRKYTVLALSEKGWVVPHTVTAIMEAKVCIVARNNSRRIPPNLYQATHQLPLDACVGMGT